MSCYESREKAIPERGEVSKTRTSRKFEFVFTTKLAYSSFYGSRNIDSWRKFPLMLRRVRSLELNGY